MPGTNETMIPLTKKTRGLLRSIGYKGETWDQLLERIASFYIEEHTRVQRRGAMKA